MVNNKIYIKARQVSECAHLMIPPETSGVGVISFPFSSRAFEIFTVARTVAIALHTTTSPRCWPGHTLHRMIRYKLNGSEICVRTDDRSQKSSVGVSGGPGCSANVQERTVQAIHIGSGRWIQPLEE